MPISLKMPDKLVLCTRHAYKSGRLQYCVSDLFIVECGQPCSVSLIARHSTCSSIIIRYSACSEFVTSHNARIEYRLLSLPHVYDTRHAIPQYRALPEYWLLIYTEPDRPAVVHPQHRALSDPVRRSRQDVVESSSALADRPAWRNGMLLQPTMV